MQIIEKQNIKETIAACRNKMCQATDILVVTVGHTSLMGMSKLGMEAAGGPSLKLAAAVLHCLDLCSRYCYKMTGTG